MPELQPKRVRTIIGRRPAPAKSALGPTKVQFEVAPYAVANGAVGQLPRLNARARLPAHALWNAHRRAMPQPCACDARTRHDRPRIGGSASGYRAQRTQGCRASVHGRCCSGLAVRRSGEPPWGRKAGILNKSIARPRYQLIVRCLGYGTGRRAAWSGVRQASSRSETPESLRSILSALHVRPRHCLRAARD